MAQRHTDGPLVLVVEDFEDTRAVMRHFLERGGCRVVEASDGREAIERVRELRPDLVLMDLNMPVLDGFTATLRLREEPETRAVPVVAVTAYDTSEFRAAARAVGCNEYVAKPLDFPALMTLVERLLPGWFTNAGPTEAVA
jgi:two-component system cell cycle response regulator DivK